MIFKTFFVKLGVEGVEVLFVEPVGEDSKILAEALESSINDLEDIRKQWEKAVKQGVKNQNAKAASDKNQNIKAPAKVQEKLRGVPSDAEIQKNIEYVANMKPVAELKGTEFAKGNVDLVTQVSEYFKSIGGQVETKYGRIILDKRGAKSSIGHGIGRNKAIAFKAVPSVLKQGRIIDFQKNWKKRNYDTAVFAANISINKVNYYMAAVVTSGETNAYYLHEVALIEKGDTSVFKTVAADKTAHSTELSPIYSLLKKIQDVKDIRYQDRIYGIGNAGTFPPYDESKSDANEWATRWAHREDVKTGDWRLASYHDRWYIIEKFDNMPLKYIVTEYVPKAKYSDLANQWRAKYGRSFEEELEREQNKISNNNRKAASYGDERSDIDDDVPEYSRKDREVLGLDKNENSKQPNQLDSDESTVGGNENRQGNGASGLDFQDRDSISSEDELLDDLI